MSAAWTAALGRASLESALAVLAVAAVIRLVPRLPAWARCALWWLASARALIACAGLPGVPLPLLPAASAPASLPGAAAPLSSVAAAPALPAPSAGAPFDPVLLAWFAIAVLWAAGALVLALRQGLAARRALALWRGARELESDGARTWLGAWLGEPRAQRVELRASDAVAAPLLLGWGRPRIVVPASFERTLPSRARMALAHETAHLLRRDLWWGWVPALAECVFWFHPIVRWAVMEYAQSREEACDARAIELTGAEPGGYGEMLVGFGVDRVRFGHAAASCGSRHARQLTRRLHMLSHLKSMTRLQRIAVVTGVAAIGLFAIVPLRVVAAQRPAAEAEFAAPPSASTTVIEADAAGGAAAEGDGSAAAAEAEAGARTSAPVTVIEAPGDDATDAGAAGGDRPAAGHDRRGDDEADDDAFGYSWTDQGDGFSFGLLGGGDDNTLSGSFGDGDWSRIRRLSRQNPDRIFWFRLQGRDYVVHDRAIVNRVREMMKPQIELGRRQGALGAQQAELGEQQARLGSRQAGLGARQAELAARLADLSMDASFGDASRAERAEMRRKIDDIQDRIHVLSRQQRELGDQQQALGDQQSELGAKQSALGERQRAEAERARPAVRRLAAQCVRDGRAERWKD